MPKLVSTRGLRGIEVENGLVMGYAKDGGLLMPEQQLNLPWKNWKDLNYPNIVLKIVQEYVKDESIQGIIRDVYASGAFDTKDVVNLVQLTDDCHVLEMFHGPTWSFKDYAMTPLVKIIQQLMQKQQRSVTLLVATSGDTGGAALHAVKGCANVNLVLLMPHGRVSKIQYLQMSTSHDRNIRVFDVDANSDELDDILRPVFADESLNKTVNLSSVNSICWGRVMIQMAHYFYAYFRVCRSVGQPVTIVVPTGAAGNLVAGILAQSCGLPIKLVACTNENDIMHRFITTGVFKMSEAKKTLATAMDIQVPYNVERIVYLLSNGDPVFVKQFMESFTQNGVAKIPSEMLGKLQSWLSSAVITDNQIVDTIQWCQDEYKYIVCPHTATALSWAKLNCQRNDKNPVVCIATATPEKFGEELSAAGIQTHQSEKLKQLKKLEGDPSAVKFLGKECSDLWTQKVVEAIYDLNNL